MNVFASIKKMPCNKLVCIVREGTDDFFVLRVWSKIRNQFCLLPYLLVLALGFYFLRESVATSAFRWMRVYNVQDFLTVGGFFNFLKSLQIPLPLNLLVLEFLDYHFFNNLSFVRVFLYRFMWVGSFLLVIYFSHKTNRRHIVTVCALFFLWVISVVHRNMPMIYDAFYPCSILLSILFFQMGDTSKGGKSKIAYFLLSGFFFAMTDFLRPFFIYIYIGLFVLLVPYFLKNIKSCFVPFFLVSFLISGAYHIYLFVNFDLFTSSNHVGFNLARAWDFIPFSPLEEEKNNAPLGPGRMNNINTVEHRRNSKRLEADVKRYIINNPEVAIPMIAGRLRALVIGEVSIYGNRPSNPLLNIYLFLHALFFSFIYISFIFVLINKNVYSYQYYQENIVSILLLYITLSSLLLLSLGEHGEEARFSLSVLPLVMAFFGNFSQKLLFRCG